VPGAEIVFPATTRGVQHTERGGLGLVADRTLAEVERPGEHGAAGLTVSARR